MNTVRILCWDFVYMFMSFATLRRALSQRIVRAVLPTGASSSDAQVQAALAAFRTAQDKMDASALKQAISKLGVAVSSQVRVVWCMSGACMRIPVC